MNFFNIRYSPFIAITLVVGLLIQSRAQEKGIGDISDGNRSIPVHLIDLYDEDGYVIKPDDEPLLPFSIKETCQQKCHDYQIIQSGWHFNSNDPNIPPGRHGEPWIFVDRKTATQIPISYRSWSGTFYPDQIGLIPWFFIQTFGRHKPGGGIGEDEDAQSPDFYLRWMVSGDLEVNCLSCHNGDPAHDQAEYATQIARQNYRWAPAASSRLASMKGSAKNMPDTYDIYSGTLPDEKDVIPPAISYHESSFDPSGKVFFDVVRKVPNERCNFCHSTKDIDQTSSDNRWETDEDIHLSAGLICVDCHRNSLNHNIVRGYEGEKQGLDNPAVFTLSCQGCHMETELEITSVPISGRLGAPRPDHKGIPQIHFEKISCTACHSGPWPSQQVHRIKTSRAHKLGLHNVNKADTLLPHIISPVFVKQENGEITPVKMFWPAFWATLSEDKVTPITPDIVKPIVRRIIINDTIPSVDWPALNNEDIVKILNTLSSGLPEKTNPVYICGGKLFKLNDSGQLSEEEHPAAQPYSWPLAHDVRPSSQSLGIRGCLDCHDTDSPFFFGEVTVDKPLNSTEKSQKVMIEFQNLDAFYIKMFAMSFMFRPWLKIIVIGSTLFLCGVLLLYTFKGLDYLLKTTSKEDMKQENKV